MAIARPRSNTSKSTASFSARAHGFTLIKPGVGHDIIFADGPFTYHVGVGWGPQVRDTPTREQLVAAATTLFRRVHARPAP